jgi:hypothetical protein
MPLFGKKSPAGGKSSKEATAAPTVVEKKTPTVEDKYDLKAVLGT